MLVGITSKGLKRLRFLWKGTDAFRKALGSNPSKEEEEEGVIASYEQELLEPLWSDIDEDREGDGRPIVMDSEELKDSVAVNITSSSILRGVFRGLFEAGYIKEVKQW